MKNPIIIRYESGQMIFASPDCLLEIDNQKLKKLVFRPLFEYSYSGSENENTIEQHPALLVNTCSLIDQAALRQQ